MSRLPHAKNTVLICLAAGALMGCSQLDGEPIEIGQVVNGELEAGDDSRVFRDRSPTDLYSVRLNKAQTVTISVVSCEFDSYLAVFACAGEPLVQNDDLIPGSPNSAVTFTPPTKGEFTIAVTGVRPSELGAYSLTVRE
jgi:hypothetical protein